MIFIVGDEGFSVTFYGSADGRDPRLDERVVTTTPVYRPLSRSRTTVRTGGIEVCSGYEKRYESGLA